MSYARFTEFEFRFSGILPGNGRRSFFVPRVSLYDSSVRLSIPQSVLGDDELLDVGRAFDDLVGLRVA